MRAILVLLVLAAAASASLESLLAGGVSLALLVMCQRSANESQVSSSEAPPASRHPDEELLASIFVRSGRLVLRRRRA